MYISARLLSNIQVLCYQGTLEGFQVLNLSLSHSNFCYFVLSYFFVMNFTFYTLVHPQLSNYWTPGLGRKDPIKQGQSVLVCLCVSFLRIGSLVSSETQHGVRGPYLVVCDRARFLGKNRHQAKMVKNGPKTWFLDFLRKSRHQFCLEFV